MVDNTNAEMTAEKLEEFRTNFSQHPYAGIVQNAVTNTTVIDVALNRDIVTETDFSFSTFLDEWKVTNQKSSGRCWMFACLNLLRVGAMKKMNLKDFEFSQNYTLFWDKFERANWTLEAIIGTADREVGDRTVSFLLSHPLDDGGQWNMAMNVIKKHGLVPKSAMPESESSSSTRRMNSVLWHMLRQGSKKLRDMLSSGKSLDETRVEKDKIMGEVWRILCIHLGTPPSKFDWQWKDKDNNFHRDGILTPQEFAEKYVTLPLEEYVCLVNDPRKTSPYGSTFTVEHLGNVVNGEDVLYLNIEMDLMKKITQDLLESGEPVWFGCDVGKMMQRELGLWDSDLYKFEEIYDVEFNLDKEGRLNYQQTQMTHAMLFTGVDVVDGKPRRWRVENSWGDKRSGRKGYYTMNDNWFDEFMFEIAAPKSMLPEELVAALEKEPIVLPPWDPMGSLAN